MITSSIDWGNVTIGSIIMGLSKENLNPNFEYINLCEKSHQVYFFINPELYLSLKLPSFLMMKYIPKIEGSVNIWMVVNYK